MSLRPQGEGQKNAHGLSPMHTESLTRIFLTFVFSMQRDSKRICKRYRLRLLRFRLSCDMLFFAYIYCPKESKCHALAGFVLFVRLLPFGQWVFDKSRVQKKHSRMNYIKLTTNLPNPTNIYRVVTYKIRQIRAITSLWSVGLRQISCSKKIYSRMNYIKLNTNLPNQTNIYHVEPKKIRVIRAIRVRKKYIRV